MPRPRTRRRALLAGAVVAVAVPVAALAVRDDGPSDATTTTSGAAAPPARTAEVERRDLVDTVEVEGTLGYGDRRSVRGAGPGTVTALPELGATVGPDQPLYWVDGGPGPIVLDGALPLWRPLESGVEDGPDVAQLEANLLFLGYADDDLTVDEELTWETVEAIEAWQEAHGLEETGRVEPGDVWYSEGPARVAATTAAVGEPAQGEVLQVTGTDRFVQVDLAIDESPYAHEGDAIDLELADGTTATGTITDVADVATVTPGQGGEPATTTVAVEIVADTELEALDESPVTVSLTTDEVADALAVPLEAIVATSGGAFAVEVVDDAGGRRLVDVELGRVADGWVQVTGEVAEGQTVVTA